MINDVFAHAYNKLSKGIIISKSVSRYGKLHSHLARYLIQCVTEKEGNSMKTYEQKLVYILYIHYVVYMTNIPTHLLFKSYQMRASTFCTHTNSNDNFFLFSI